jgi:diguanylate cyclase (GGDEF)-like protein/PAS domain S-box-containing protein
MKRLIARMPVLGVGLAAGIFVIASVASYYGIVGMETSMSHLSGSHAMIQDLHVLSESLRGAQASFRGYLLTGNTDLMEDYPMQMATFRGAFERLKGMSSDSGAAATSLITLESYANECFAFMNRSLALAQSGDLEGALRMVRTGEGKRLLARAEGVLTPMLEVEYALAGNWRHSVEASARGLAWILGLSLLSTVIVMVVAAWGALRENVRLGHAEEKLRESETRVFQFLNALPVGVYVMDAGGNPYFTNKAGERILGRGLFKQLKPSEMSEAYDLRRAKTGEPYPEAELPLVRALAGESREATDIEVHRPDGSVVPVQVWGTPVFNAHGKVAYAMTAFADMTERQALLSKLESLSRYDTLTGLYNRRAFMEEAEMQLKMAAREGTARLLFFADMDNLKWVNDNLGHQEGDKAIHDMARVLRVGFRDTDLIGRLGGDEFVVLAYKNGANGATFAEQFRERLERINRQKGRKYQLDFSYGHVEFDPANPVSLEELIARADELMYSHKRYKKGQTSEDPISAALSKAAHTQDQAA